MSRQGVLLLIWLLASVLAALFALEMTHATYYEGVWHPVGNDSFYHARRILDAVNSPRGFYQFDDMIHAAEGSWLTWPWAYDWSMAKIVQLWQWINPDVDQMELITHMAVYWIFVNAALLLGVMLALKLPVPFIMMAMLAFGLSPLTQMLHAVGIIDHHYVEYSFVLLTLLSGLLWLRHPERISRAALLGITLGIAPAFHTGLFILQLPVIASLFILWLRDELPESNSVLALSCALILALLVALIPSEPFLQGQFQFSVLSWFHLYIGASSTLLISCMAQYRYRPKTLIGLGVLGLLLLIPIWQDTIGGASFLSQNILLLEGVTETQTPYEMLTGKVGPWKTFGYYSLALVALPFLIPAYLYQAWKTPDSERVFFSVMVVFGTTLLLTQYRLNYFGSFAILLGWLVLLSDRFEFPRTRPLLTSLLGALLVAALAFPSIDRVLFTRYSLSWNERYQEALPAIAALGAACAANPGTVLADNNFGHILRFHTDCRVIANNFLMTRQHEDKIIEMWRLMDLSPEELLEDQAKPRDLRYVFAFLSRYIYRAPDGQTLLANDSLLQKNNRRLLYELNTRDELPPGYREIGSIMLDAERNVSLLKLVEIQQQDGGDTGR